VVKLILRGKRVSKKISQTYNDDDQHHVGKPLDFLNLKKRLDLNDLLRRAKDEEKSEKKFNLLIYSCAVSVAVVFLLIMSI